MRPGREKRDAWKKANPEKQREYRRASEKKRREEGKAAIPRRKYDLKRRYGITPEEYDKLLESTGGVCPICGSSGRRMHLDHCHETGKIRGFLCLQCNTAIGKLGHSVEILKKCIDWVLQ